MCWWGCHSDRGARCNSVVCRQHLHLWIGPYHNGLLLLFTGLEGAAGSHVLPGSDFSISRRFIIDCSCWVYQSCRTTARDLCRSLA